VVDCRHHEIQVEAHIDDFVEIVDHVELTFEVVGKVAEEGLVPGALL
jgi:hypothetical protein